MSTKKILIISSIFPYGAYLIHYFWSCFSGLERVSESTQIYFMLISVYFFMALSGTEWNIIFYKAFQRQAKRSPTNIIIFLHFSIRWLG